MYTKYKDKHRLAVRQEYLPESATAEQRVKLL